MRTSPPRTPPAAANPPAADVLLGQLRVLTALTALFDPEMLAAVADQVVPVAVQS